MQENNFAKAAQEKLDSFSLTPSEPVWQKIEAAIKKKRERRLLWLLPFLMLGSSLVWYGTTKQDEKIAQNRTLKIKQPAQTFSKPHVPQSNQTLTAKIKISGLEISAVKAPEPITTSVKLGIKQKEDAATTSRRYVAIAIIPNNEINKTNNAEKSTTNLSLINKSKPIPTDKILSNSTKEKPAQILKTKASAEPNNTATKTAVAPNESPQNVIAQTASKNKASSKWTWRIVSRAGLSTLKENLFSVSASKAARAQNDYYASFPSGLGNGNYNANRSKPAPPTNGLQFSLGVLLQKPIGKKSSLITGLHYGFYSMHVAVGAQLSPDSVNRNATLFSLSAQNIYGNNSRQNRVTNSFHFIELPVGIEHRFLKNESLHLQYGIAFSQLLKSNALQYDGIANVYYKAASRLRKTNVAFFTGVEYTLWKKKTVALQAGPYVQYGLRNSFKNGQRSHLVSNGIQLHMNF